VQTAFAVTGSSRTDNVSCPTGQIVLGGGFTVTGGTVSQSNSHNEENDATNSMWVFTWSKISSNPVVTPYLFCATP
jgi:hypothetical protein